MRKDSLYLLPFFLFLACKLRATDYTWTGSAGNHDWATAANWSPMGVPTSSDIASFVGTSDSVFFAAPAAVANVKILKNGVVPSNIAFKSLGNYTLTVASLTAASSLILESACQLSITSDASGHYLTLDIGTLSAASAAEMAGTMSLFGYERTYRTDGGALLKVSSGVFNVLDWLNFFGGANPVLTGTGRLIIQSNGSFYLQRDGYDLPNIEYHPTAHLIVVAKTLGSMATTAFGHVTVNSPSLNANQNLGFPSAQNVQVFIYGNLTMSSLNNQQVKLGEAVWALQVAGDLTIYNGTVAFSNHSVATFTTPYIYVTLQGNLTIENGGSLDLQLNTGEVSLILQKDLTVAAGGTLKASLAQATYPANLTNSKVTFGHTAAVQTWIANGSLGNTGYNFFIDKSVGKVVLGSNLVLPNHFVFNNGNVEIGDYSLTATDNIAGVGSFSASRHFILGSLGALTLRKVSASEKIFPIGVSADSYDELKINRPSPSPVEIDFTVSLKNSFSHTVPPSGNVPREWDIRPAATPGMTQLVFKPDPLVNLGTVPTPVVGHWSGSAWQELAATYSAGAYTVQTSSFSPFGVGTAGGFEGVLPLSFLRIQAMPMGESNRIEWTVSDDSDVRDYRVERLNSSGQSEGLVSQILVHPTTPSVKNATPKTYEAIDNQAFSQTYYRIRSRHFSGEERLSKIISVRRESALCIKSLYPMPFTEGVTVAFNQAIETDMSISISDILGRQIFAQKQFSVNGAMLYLNLNTLPVGTYILKMTDGKNHWTQNLLKR